VSELVQHGAMEDQQSVGDGVLDERDVGHNDAEHEMVNHVMANNCKGDILQFTTNLLMENLSLDRQ
jgi:hypothetical protein